MASIKDPEVAEIDAVNPMGTDGFEFVEYTAPEPAALGSCSSSMGFVAVAQHRSKNVTLSARATSTSSSMPSRTAAQGFARVHGPGLRHGVPRQGRGQRLQARLSLGAGPSRTGRADGAQHPRHRGHRRSLIYLVDRYGDRGTIYDVDFVPARRRGHAQRASASPTSTT